MFNKTKNPLVNKKNKPLWLIAPFTTLVAILILYYINGVVPFGENSVVTHDLFQATYPTMNYVWDILHGKANAYYDFQVACGYGRNIFSTLLQPQYLFAALFPRDKIYDSISYLMLIKYVLVALASSYSFKKIFPKLSIPWVNTLSLMYTFCGFNILYCSNIDWLDVTALFPLIIAGMVEMFRTSDKRLYFFSLAYLMLINTYMSWFVILSLIIFAGLYIIIVSPKEQKAHNAYCLGAGTGAAIIANAYQVYLLVKTFTGGARYDRGSFYADGRTGNSVEIKSISDLFSVPNSIDICSVFMFLGTAVAFVSLIFMWIAFKKHKETRKHTIFFTSSILLMIFEVCITATLLLWHGGSYQFFPYRNGFTVMFMCCLIVGYCNTELEHFGEIKFKNRIFNLIPFVALFFLTIGLIAYFDVFSFQLSTFQVMNSLTTYQARTFIYPYVILSILLIITFIIIKTISLKQIKNILCIVLVLVSLTVNNYKLFSYAEADILTENYALNNENYSEDKLSRIYNQDTSLGYNFNYVLGSSGIGNWTPMIDTTQVKAFKALGFSTLSAIIYDKGATKFSKAILHITDLITSKKIYDADYILTENTDDKYYYKNNIVLPFGYTADKDILDINADDYENTFLYQEAIYEALTGNTGLFTKIDNNIFTEKFKKNTFYENIEDEITGEKKLNEIKGKLCTLSTEIYTPEKTTYYLYIEDAEHTLNATAKSLENNKNKTTIDSTDLQVPLELGTYCNETANFKISFESNNANKNSVSIYALNISKLEELCNAYTSDEYEVNDTEVKIKTNSQSGKVIVLPLTYDEKWSVTLNGEKVTPHCVLGSFIAIDAADGENIIELNYSHNDFNYSVLFCILSLTVGLVVFFTEKKYSLIGNNIVSKICYILLVTISVTTILILYVIPLIDSIIT